ncbi:unnamed protein product, partial [Laminaria digitata]
GGRSGDDDGVADIDRAIDRYDYLIAFPNPRERSGQGSGGGGDEEDSATSSGKRFGDLADGGGDSDDGSDVGTSLERITLTQVNDIWYSAVPGDEVTKTAARESLKREWEARFRVPTT